MLRGREAELARVSRLLADARDGSGGALVVRGEPGSGKTALLAAAVAAAQAAGDVTVLRTQGIESEAPLAFAALQRLLRPVLQLADKLPAPQAHALRVAFGEVGDEPTADRFLTFLGTLSLLAEAADERVVLVVVDDAHWLDEASKAALLFVARRLQVERIALLLGARVATEASVDADDLEELRLTGLDLAATTELLRDEAGVDVSPEVAAQLLASTGGNPLALVELPRALTHEQLDGRAVLPGRLPVTATVERVFLDQARRLSEHAQRLLLLVAADDSTRWPTVSAAAQALGIDPGALAEAERSGLVTVVDEDVRLRHPLVRSALYAAATLTERQQAHAALAEVMTQARDADRRVWHRVASLTEPTPEVLAELDEAAENAERRGGWEAAAAAWERAAELTHTGADRARRLLGAARSAWFAGQAGRAARLSDAALAEADDPLLHADAVRLRARVEWNTGSITRGHQLVLEGARDVAGHDADRARELAMFASALASFEGDSGVGVDPREFATVPGDAGDRIRCMSELIVGLGLACEGEWQEAGATLRDCFATERRAHVDDQDLLPNLGVAGMVLGDVDAIVTFHERLLARARSEGSPVMVLYALTRLAFADVPLGTWGQATTRQTEARRLGEATGQPLLAAMPLAWLLLLSALRGEEGYDEQAAALEGLEDLAAQGTLRAPLHDVIRWARGMRDFPRSAGAFHHLAQITLPVVQRLAALDRIEAAVHADQRDLARAWVDDLERFGTATEQPWATAIAAHGRALLAADPAPEFEEALRLHQAQDRPFARARTHLAYGEHLRRSRQRVAAREQLRAALDIFEDLRAAPWTSRAAQELRASGETARRRDETQPVTLTPTELQVAQLVQGGMSNREVAAQLFVSPRTVDFHLRNVFAKSGVTSRLELARLQLAP